MTVYVDNMRSSFGRMIMVHMLADTAEELHAMADKIGVQRKWFQGDHYDVCLEKRKLAVAAGAQEVTSREIVRVRRRWWERYAPDSEEAMKARILDEIEACLEVVEP